MAPTKTQLIASGLAALSLIFIGISVSTVLPWAEFARTREIGPVEYTLQGSCDPVGFEYALETRPTQGGFIGGGIGNVSIDPGRKTYSEARGDFLDNLGLIYDSYKDKEYVYEIRMEDPPEGSGIVWDPMEDPSAYLNVTLRSNNIPFWTSSGNEMGVEVRFVSCDLSPGLGTILAFDLEVRIDRIEVIGWTEVDSYGNYHGDQIILFSSEEGWTLKELGDSIELGFSAGYPDGAPIMGIKARIEAHLTDFWGRPEKQTLSGSSGYLNVYPVETSTLVQGAGLPLSGPIIGFSLVTGILGIFLVFARRSIYKHMFAISGSLGLLAPLWFFAGMNAAVDLLGKRLAGAEQGLAFQPGIILCTVGGALILATGAASFFLDRKKNEIGKQGSGKFKLVEKEDDNINSN